MLPTNNNSRIIYLDILRIIATIAVIFTHVSAMHLEDLSCNSTDWQIHNLYASLSRWSVPIFLMISGALFLNHDKNVKISILYKKNILRIMTALIVWSFIYAFFQYLTIERYHNPSSIIGLTIIGHYHLWFLYLILGIYISLPVLVKISENKNVLHYFMLASFIFTFILPLITETGKNILPQQAWDSFNAHPYFLEAINHNYNFFCPHIFIGYVFYFMFGHYLNIKEINTRLIRFIAFGGLCGAIGIILGTYFSTSSQNEFSGSFYHYLNICPLFEATAIFCIVKYIPHHHNGRINVILSKSSFGTYLIHPILIEICLMFDIDTMIICPMLSIPLMVSIIFITSTLISYVLMRIPIIKRFCI